jgi:hypothetical protein
MQIVKTTYFIFVVRERVAVPFNAMVSTSIRISAPEKAGGGKPSIAVLTELIITTCNTFEVTGEIGVYSGVKALKSLAQTSIY